MIVTAFIQTIYYLVYAICSPFLLLPNVTLPQAFADTITTASGYLSSLNSFLPIDTIITILKISIAIEVAYLTFKLIMWVIKRIPTQS